LRPRFELSKAGSQTTCFLLDYTARHVQRLLLLLTEATGPRSQFRLYLGLKIGLAVTISSPLVGISPSAPMRTSRMVIAPGSLARLMISSKWSWAMIVRRSTTSSPVALAYS